jgi:sulfatase maturation enzyme AslB (radical SAM superfamily)
MGWFKSKEQKEIEEQKENTYLETYNLGEEFFKICQKHMNEIDKSVANDSIKYRVSGHFDSDRRGWKDRVDIKFDFSKTPEEFEKLLIKDIKKWKKNKRNEIKNEKFNQQINTPEGLTKWLDENGYIKNLNNDKKKL